MFPGLVKRSAAADRKPNPVPFDSPRSHLSALRRIAQDDDHSSSPAITGGIKQPTRKCFERAVRVPASLALGECDLPIWPCSVRGFACHRCCHRRGALLPHLFTLTAGCPVSGMLSVPLSFELPRPGVTRRTALRSSDFPPRLTARRSSGPLRRNSICLLACCMLNVEVRRHSELLQHSALSIAFTLHRSPG